MGMDERDEDIGSMHSGKVSSCSTMCHRREVKTIDMGDGMKISREVKSELPTLDLLGRTNANAIKRFESMLRGKMAFESDAIQESGESALCEAVKKEAKNLKKKKIREQKQAQVLRDLKRLPEAEDDESLGESHEEKRKEEETDVDLYLRLQTQFEERAATLQKSQKTQDTQRHLEIAADALAAEFAFSPHFLASKNASEQDKRVASQQIHFVKQKCTQAVAAQRQYRLEVEEAERVSRREALRLSQRRRGGARHLWAKTKNSLNFRMLVKTTEKIDTERQAFFDDYHRLRDGMELGAIDETSITKNSLGHEAYIVGCLKLGVSPEPLLNADHPSTSVNLAHFGLGHDRLEALSKALPGLAPKLESIDLADNRLSPEAATSLLRILAQALEKITPHGTTALAQLSLEDNADALANSNAVTALATVLEAAPSISVLKLRSTGLKNYGLEFISEALLRIDYKRRRFKYKIDQIELNRNALTAEAAVSIGAILAAPSVDRLRKIDLSWNSLSLLAPSQRHHPSRMGALLGPSLAENRSLEELNLGHNGLRDDDIEGLALALAENTRLRRLLMPYNRLTSRSALVLASVLAEAEVAAHVPRLEPSGLRLLDLNGNPIGRSGARAILGRRLRGALKTQVILHDCGLFRATTKDKSATDAEKFEIDHVSRDSPFELDMSRPHDRAVASEIARAVCLDRGRLSIEHLDTTSKKNSNATIVLTPSAKTKNDSVVSEWILQQQSKNEPYRFPMKGRVRLHYKSNRHGILVSQKKCAVSAVVQNLINILVAEPSRAERSVLLRMLLSDVYLTTEQAGKIMHELVQMEEPTSLIELVSALWLRLIDDENKLEFLTSNFESHALPRALQSMRLEAYEKYALSQTNPTAYWYLEIGREAHRYVLNALLDVADVERRFGFAKGRDDTSQCGDGSNFRNIKVSGVPRTLTENEIRDLLDSIEQGVVIEFDFISYARPNTVKATTKVEPVGFDYVAKIRGYLERYVEKSTQKNWKDMLILLRLATLGKYFTTRQVLALHDYMTSAFSSEERSDITSGIDHRSADVIVTMFSRLFDLENFSADLAAQLSRNSVELVASRLGWLNIGNPFVLPPRIALDLRHRDNRRFAYHLLVLATQETTNDKSSAVYEEEPTSECTIASLYARLGSMQTVATPAVLRVRHSAETTPNWRARMAILRSFLLGTPPVPRRVFDTHPDLRRLAARGNSAVRRASVARNGRPASVAMMAPPSFP